jgi:hypothetical protein
LHGGLFRIACDNLAREVQSRKRIFDTCADVVLSIDLHGFRRSNLETQSCEIGPEPCATPKSHRLAIEITFPTVPCDLLDVVK